MVNLQHLQLTPIKMLVGMIFEAAEKPSYRYTYNAYKNKTATSVTGEYTIDSIVESTGAISKISSDVKVTATTKAEQKLSLIINKYVA